MPTLDDVRRQIENIPSRYVFWTQKEIKALPAILDEKERIKALTSGILNGKTWLAVCTDRRLLFINHGMFLGVQQIQMPLDRVQSLDHQYTVFFGSITVYDGINQFTMQLVQKSSIEPFVKATEEAMHALKQNSKTAPATAPTGDIASQLAKLADLKEKGYLTEEEFQAQKKKLLG